MPIPTPAPVRAKIEEIARQQLNRDGRVTLTKIASMANVTTPTVTRILKDAKLHGKNAQRITSSAATSAPKSKGMRIAQRKTEGAREAVTPTRAAAILPAKERPQDASKEPTSSPITADGIVARIDILVRDITSSLTAIESQVTELQAQRAVIEAKIASLQTERQAIKAKMEILRPTSKSTASTRKA